MRIRPGEIALTRTLRGPHSTARLRASCTSAAFDSPYRPIALLPRTPEMLEMMITLPPPLVRHLRHDQAGKPMHAAQVDGHGQVPVGVGGAVERTHVRRDAGIAHEHVDTPMRGQRRLHESIRPDRGGDVAGNAAWRPRLAHALLRHTRAFVRFIAGDDHTRAGPRHGFGDREADPAGRAGDQRDFAVEAKEIGSDVLIAALVPCSDRPRHVSSIFFVSAAGSASGVGRCSHSPICSELSKMNLQRS